MTIAAGFVCSDGVVLAADTQLSSPLSLKYSGRKIWTISKGALKLVLAGAGSDLVFIRRMRDELERRLAEGMTTEDVVAKLETALQKMYSKHIRGSSREADLRVMYLAGVVASDGCALFETSDTVVSRVDATVCIGYGQDIGNYIADEMQLPAMTVHRAEILASYLIQQAKLHANFCGGDTHVISLFASGDVRRLGINQIKFYEGLFRNGIRSLHPILFQAAETGGTPESLQQHLERFRKYFLLWQQARDITAQYEGSGMVEVSQPVYVPEDDHGDGG